MPDIPFSAILDFLQKRKEFIQGVVLSGGEPTLHATARGISSAVRAAGFRVKLDTNGLLPEKISGIGPDYLALDIKTIPANYPKLLGAREIDVASRLEQSIAMVKTMKENAEIRITIAPGIIDINIIEELAQMIKGVKNAYLQPMQTKTDLLDPAMGKKELISMEEIKTYRRILLNFAENCEIRGL